MRNAWTSCRFYSWMRLTWRSKMVSGSTVCPEVDRSHSEIPSRGSRRAWGSRSRRSVPCGPTAERGRPGRSGRGPRSADAGRRPPDRRRYRRAGAAHRAHRRYPLNRPPRFGVIARAWRSGCGSCRRVRPRAAGLRHPLARTQLFELRTGLGGPTPPGRPGAHTTPPAATAALVTTPNHRALFRSRRTPATRSDCTESAPYEAWLMTLANARRIIEAWRATQRLATAPGAPVTELLWGVTAGIEGLSPSCAPVASLAHDHPDRRRVKAVARVAGLRAVRDHGEDVHLGAEVDIVAGLREALGDRHRAVEAHGNVHEPVQVGDDVLLAETEGRQRAQEVLAAVGGVLDAVAKLVALGAAAAANGVVATAGVFNDGEETPAHIRVDAVPLGEEDRPRVLHGVGSVVALRGILGIVAEEVDRLLAFEVDDAKDLTVPEHAPPVPVGWNDPVLDDLARKCRHASSPSRGERASIPPPSVRVTVAGPSR